RLERNKFLIKFREHDKPPLLNSRGELNANRRSSISWDIPFDHHKNSFGSNQKTIESIKEVEDNESIKENLHQQQQPQQQQREPVQEQEATVTEEMSCLNDILTIIDANNVVAGDENAKQPLTPSLTRWKGSFNLNDDAGTENKFPDKKDEKLNEPILLKESLLTTD
ncbi:hypothetical protein BLA29_010617, partial [Euroglyphus maynei]